MLQYMYEQKKISKAQQEEALADDVYSRIQNVDAVKKESVNPYSYFTDELIEQVIQDLMEKLDVYKRHQLYGCLPYPQSSMPRRRILSSASFPFPNLLLCLPHPACY